MSNVAIQRLFTQQLEQTQCRTPKEVVTWLGAVQAQEFLGALWALRLRLPDMTESAIESAFRNGDILRTHMMRPTWHFVAPEDIRWIQSLTAPRVHAVNAFMYRQLELDDAVFVRSNTAIAKALADGRQLTRLEIGTVLGQVGIVAEGMRLGYIVHHAELEAIICSGPRRGKQFTYMLLEERAPQTKTLDRDEALAELTRRYFTSHGPATVKDFVWWSGLTQADAKAGLEMVNPNIVSEVIDGKTYWFSEAIQPANEPSHTAFLLPTYDEFVIGYTDRSAMFDESQTDKISTRGNIVFDSMIVIDGQIVGSWRRTFSKGTVIIESVPLRPLTVTESEALDAAAQRYGEFLNMSVVLT